MYTYNIFRDKQASIDFWWDETEFHLHLRRDLIPSLLDRARPLMGPQASTLDRIAGIREEIVRDELEHNSKKGSDIERLENNLSAEMLVLQSAFKEQHEIQMNSELLTVMGELVSIEGKALIACNEYNKLANAYNASIKSFPANVVVGLLHFNPKEKRIFGSFDKTVTQA
jgi:LemA protein